MSILDNWAKLPPADRDSRLAQLGIKEAILALGLDDGVAFLEAHIDSPVSFSWGNLLYLLKSPWSHLERWLGRSKLHCLAAVDALRCYAEEREMPTGASTESIHGALDAALAAHGNPRIKMAAKEIRRTWPIGGRKSHGVEIPPAVEKIAEILLLSDPARMTAWRKSISTDVQIPDEPEDFWISLIEFCQAQELLAIVDWRERLSEVVAQLKTLQPSRPLDLAWDNFASLHVELEKALKVVGVASVSQGMTLVSLDRGADEYILTFLPSSKVPILIAALEPLGLAIDVLS